MRVLADGCFDPLHVGHVTYLRHAASLGHPLVVHVAPDSAIVAKGRTPFQRRNERSLTILALGMVDRVCQYESLAEAIREIQPHYLAKGPDWKDRLPPDVLQACHECGVTVVYTETQGQTSTERLRA